MSDTGRPDCPSIRRMNAFQFAIIGLCGLMAMIDGMDTQAIGLVAPAIAADWHVPAASFGLVFGSSLFSGLIGALVLGQAGDRIGRKPILIFAILLLGLSSLATPLTHSISGLLTGLKFPLEAAFRPGTSRGL